MKNKLFRAFPLFLLLATMFLLTGYIYKNFNLYQKKFNPEQLSTLYNSSQFAQKTEDRKFIIQDHYLYGLAGWYYLKTGIIETINIEHPPLGKYFIGLSIRLFGNQNVGQIFWSILFLFLLYQLSFKVLKNKLFSLLTVFLFSQEKLFLDQLSHSLLDLPLGVFLLIFFLATINGINKKNGLFLFIQGISLGAISSIKYPTIALVGFFTLLVYYIFKKEKEITKKLTIITLISIAVFLLSYLPFFLKNPNPLSFYHLQIKALKIHLSHVPEYPKIQVFNVLLFDRWLSWWGEKDYIKTGFWNFLWPILTINFFFSFWKFKKNLLINLWVLFYLLFLSTRLFFPRYLFLLLPFFYLQLCYNLKIITRC